ncbi:hypothetical protein E2C01_029347 [Portunus trituberculatus]|uniref:Uncharacterized protein n=1 Tax=Portunus trituberculatus TaxID=210409 RepID=A0A5B7EN86_PORTR|nr:hypothetical protein [Portunus trituberculatus]
MRSGNNKNNTLDFPLHRGVPGGVAARAPPHNYALCNKMPRTAAKAPLIEGYHRMNIQTRSFTVKNRQ